MNIRYPIYEAVYRILTVRNTKVKNTKAKNKGIKM